MTNHHQKEINVEEHLRKMVLGYRETMSLGFDI